MSDGGADHKHTVLVVDDEESVREAMEVLLEDLYDTLMAENGEKALEILKEKNADLVILDLLMPGMGGMEALDRIKDLADPPEIVILSASDTAKLGIEAVRKGAFDYLTKPYDNDELLETIKRSLEKRSLEREVYYLRSEVAKLKRYGDIVGNSSAMKEIYGAIEKIARTDSTILITGESGTGKELVAKTIHDKGLRKGGPFIPVNCAAVPSELLESEFFGHERGSFTGAVEKRIGSFALANGGTLFLDEVSTLKPELQAKLLRVLQGKEFTRVGSTRTIHLEAQIIAASNQDLRQMVEEGFFREDLFYRLNVIPLYLPPLRERGNDIGPLVDHFLERIGYRLNRQVKGITKEAMKVLKAYNWPGNVRELENLLERMIAFSSDGSPLGFQDLPLDLSVPGIKAPPGQDTVPEGFYEAREKFERMLILSALQKADGNRSEAARSLQIHRNTLLKKLNSLGIEAQD